MSRSFSLAPMSPMIQGLTIALWLIPLGFGLWALISRQPFAGLIFLLVIALYGGVWFWARPARFVVTHDFLKIEFPAWRRAIPMGDISQVRSIDKATFQREFGGAIRIGAGGLWGGFGWLWTTQRGLIEFYISQVDEFVLIDRLTGKSLLITPEHPTQFVTAMQDMLAELS